ncbi:TetR/AcrR family transcriptional regulator [Streptacidiphilus sp. N1-3]|uniref:TetR/AcrR family transcriptional regulator n=1 Tax=Streptacidiphilus alkalitolerans TaxID=3342712 RepID=A0ABV6WZV1_9ACTN
MAATEATGNRLERRKAETRRKMVDAARAMLADGRSQSASIQEITDAADVGFGSFYNHFSSKAELFEVAVLDVLDEIGTALDSIGEQDEDPSERFARSVRMTVRFARTRPELARIVVRHGLDYLESDRGVAHRARRDLEAGIAAGVFRIRNPRLALASTAGALLATLQLSLLHPEEADDRSSDDLAENLLLMFGVPAKRARVLATRELPDLVVGQSAGHRPDQ